MTHPALECRDVSAGYRARAGAAATEVLTRVNFEVRTSEQLVLLGRSGSGKSTLLRLLNRLDEPLAGEVLFQGRSICDYDPLLLRRRVALVLQTPVVFDGTVRDNLLTRPKGAKAPDESALVKALDDVGLTRDILARRADSLSVGEKQRMCLARSIVPEPEILLLDEPTSALDPRSLGIIADLVLGLAERRRLAVVTATHQPELVRRLGGSVLLLADGTARSSVPAADIDRFFLGR
jgi:putative ABC transport system ATP-binding protein